MRSRVVSSITTITTVARIFHGGASVALVGMMGVIVVGVTSRYFFNSPIIGSFELTRLALAVLVTLALAHTALEKGHIRVELLVSRLPQRGQVIMEFIAGVFSLGMVSLITWQTILYAIRVIEQEYVFSSVLLFPLYPFIILLAISFMLFWLVIAVNFLDSILKAAGKRSSWQ